VLRRKSGVGGYLGSSKKKERWETAHTGEEPGKGHGRKGCREHRARASRVHEKNPERDKGGTKERLKCGAGTRKAVSV